MFKTFSAQHVVNYDAMVQMHFHLMSTETNGEKKTVYSNENSTCYELYWTGNTTFKTLKQYPVRRQAMTNGIIVTIQPGIQNQLPLWTSLYT